MIMKALLVADVDREDYWVHGLVIPLNEELETYAEILALPHVQAEIKEFDWESVVYKKVESIEIGNVFTTLHFVYDEDDEDNEDDDIEQELSYHIVNVAVCEPATACC